MLRLTSSRQVPKVLGALAALTLAPAIASSAAAQNSRVYTADQLTELPALVSPERAAAAIERSYPLRLKQQGVGGTVELRFIVDADGKVDASSIQVLASEHERLADAAVRAISRLRFTPGQINGTPVSTEILLPLTYRVH